MRQRTHKKKQKEEKKGKNEKMIKDQEITKIRKTTHPEGETNQVTDRIRNCSVTYVAKKLISHQNVNNETKWHTMIGM